MPVQNLFHGIWEAYRAAADSLWIFRRHVFRDVPATRQLQRPIASSAARSYTEENQLSTSEILVIFEDFYTHVQSARDSEEHLQQCERRLEMAQEMGDITSILLAQIDPTLRMAHLDYVTGLEQDQQRAVVVKDELRKSKKQLAQDRTTHKEQAGKRLKDFYKHAPAYFDKCLEVDFAEPWSLTENGCLKMKLLSELVNLDEQAAAQLRKSKYSLVVTRNNQWKAEKAIKAVDRVLPKATETRLDVIRTAGFASDIKKLQDQITFLEGEVANRRALLDTLQRAAVDSYIGPLLENVGRFQGRGALRSNSGQHFSGQDQDEIYSQRARSHEDLDLAEPVVDDKWHQQNESDDLRLLHKFETARSELELLQTEFALGQSAMRSSSSIIGRIVTFSNYTPADLATRITIQQQQLYGQLQRAEHDFQLAKDALLASGAQIPPSTPREQKRPTGGGLGMDTQPSSSGRRSLGSRDSGKIRRLNRRRLNRWRDAIHSDGSIRGVTKTGSLNLSKLGSSKSRSRSATRSPSTERERKLREYVAEQQKSRDEEQ